MRPPILLDVASKQDAGFSATSGAVDALAAWVASVLLRDCKCRPLLCGAYAIERSIAFAAEAGPSNESSGSTFGGRRRCARPIEAPHPSSPLLERGLFRGEFPESRVRSPEVARAAGSCVGDDRAGRARTRSPSDEDLVSRTLIRANTFDSHPQEAFDLASAATADRHRRPSVSRPSRSTSASPVDGR